MYITANDTVSASQAVSTFGRVFTRNSLFPRWRAHTSTQVGYRMWLHCELGVYIITNDGTWHVHTAQHRSSIDGCDEQLAAETSFPRTRQGHATGTVQPTPTHDGTIRPERVRSLQQTDTTDHVKTSTTTIQYVASPQLRAMPPNYAPPHTWALPTWSRQLLTIYMASAWLRHQSAARERLAFTTGASPSAAAWSEMGGARWVRHRVRATLTLTLIVSRVPQPGARWAERDGLGLERP